MRYEIREANSRDFRESLWRINDDGTEVLLGYDGGEPEDNLFCRDWKWILPELNALVKHINALKAELSYVW